MFNWDEYVPPSSDATFVGWWQVSQRSRIRVQEPTRSLKGLLCSIHQLLEGSDYADRFKGGVFTHSFLNTFDYHRWHAPVRGKVVAARVLQGQAHLDVAVGRSPAAGTDENVILTRDGTGYQFVQTRGLVIIDSPVRPRGLPAHRHGAGLVGGAHAEVGVTLRNGEELGYFQFGDSDFVMAASARAICSSRARWECIRRKGAASAPRIP